MFVRLCSVIAASLLSTSALADIVLEEAMITNGELRVVGRLNPPHAAQLTLDDKGRAVAEKDGRFSFRLVYHPADCVVAIKSGTETRQAVVGFCGQRGLEGSTAVAVATAPKPPSSTGPKGSLAFSSSARRARLRPEK